MINLTQILHLGTAWWEKEGGKIRTWLITDVRDYGIFQNGRGLKSYISESYKKYKSNQMKRLTKGGKLKDFDPSQDYMGKRLYGKKKKVDEGKGKRLTGYSAQKINDNVAFVDMTLTGQLMDGLHVENAHDNGVTMSYMERDKDKIIGNRRYDREVVGLNEENLEKLRDDILEKYSQNIAEVSKQDIILTVKLM